MVRREGGRGDPRPAPTIPRIGRDTVWISLPLHEYNALAFAIRERVGPLRRRSDLHVSAFPEPMDLAPFASFPRDSLSTRFALAASPWRHIPRQRRDPGNEGLSRGNTSTPPRNLPPPSPAPEGGGGTPDRTRSQRFRRPYGAEERGVPAASAIPRLSGHRRGLYSAASTEAQETGATVGNYTHP